MLSTVNFFACVTFAVFLRLGISVMVYVGFYMLRAVNFSTYVPCGDFFTAATPYDACMWSGTGDFFIVIVLAVSWLS